MAGQQERSIVERFVEAINSHDVDAVAGLVGPNVAISFAGLTPFEGRQRVRDYFSWFSGYGARWDLSIRSAEGGLVRCTLDAYDRWSEAAGISPLRYSRVDIVVDGGLVRRVETEFTPESNEALSAVLEGFTPWAEKRYPELYTDEGDYAYDYDTAVRMVDAMKEWKALTSER